MVTPRGIYIFRFVIGPNECGRITRNLPFCAALVFRSVFSIAFPFARRIFAANFQKAIGAHHSQFLLFTKALRKNLSFLPRLFLFSCNGCCCSCCDFFRRLCIRSCHMQLPAQVVTYEPASCCRQIRHWYTYRHQPSFSCRCFPISSSCCPPLCSDACIDLFFLRRKSRRVLKDPVP